MGFGCPLVLLASIDTLNLAHKKSLRGHIAFGLSQHLIFVTMYAIYGIHISHTDSPSNEKVADRYPQYVN